MKKLVIEKYKSGLTVYCQREYIAAIKEYLEAQDGVGSVRDLGKNTMQAFTTPLLESADIERIEKDIHDIVEGN